VTAMASTTGTRKSQNCDPPFLIKYIPIISTLWKSICEGAHALLHLL
jgi:hypothetical protein